MTSHEAAQRLKAFERDHGREMTGLATHAALPVVLNAEAVHLLRINYFLDPPHALPYTAESLLLLSPLCTEIDDGLYLIAPELRDLLLQRLIDEYGGARLRDVARLLWEYSQRRAPWEDRPGLTEAQQLTALNFIDRAGALNWLARARRGEGALPVNDDRWFVALEQDLQGRAAAIENAEGEAIFLGAKLPALVELRDALMENYGNARTALAVASKIELTIPGISEQTGVARLWQAILDAAWVSNRMPDLLQAVSDLGASPNWAKAMNEYWFRLSPALRVENGRFEEPPPEWQVLEQHRPQIQQAMRAVMLLFVEMPNREPHFGGVGVLAGDYVVLTHESVAGAGQKPSPGAKFFAVLAEDHPSLDVRPSRTFELRLHGIEEKTGLALLVFNPNQDRSVLPHPLRLMTDVPPGMLLGRKIYVTGYPTEDPRIDPAVLSRVMGSVYGVLRLQPGEIIAEDPDITRHNCFTSTGNGGGPLVDIQRGEVLGIHFAAWFKPGPRGLKEGRAISTYRLVNHPLLINAGVFRPPSTTATQAPSAGHDFIFVNRRRELDLFTSLLDRGTQETLIIQGPAGIGKSALLRQFARIAEHRGAATALVDLGQSMHEWSRGEALTRLWPQPQRTPKVIFLDNGDAANERFVTALRTLLSTASRPVLVVACRDTSMFRSNFPSAHVLTLEPLDENAFRDWFISEDVEPKPEVLDVINKAARGNPALFSTILQSARDVLPKRSAPQKAASFSPERLPTVEVVRPPTPAAITYDDDPSETHGPHVVTRGAHTLSVPENYRIGSFPVTNGIFGEFIRDGGYQHEEFWRSVHPSIRAGFVCVDKTPGPASWLSARAPVEYPLYPVAGISYHEALAFIAWLERSVAPPVEGMQWLLPTEDMWEYAARGPSGFLYPWGPKFETGRCNSREANLRAPSLSGRFPSGVSPFGAEDMAGNVWEFVRAADQDRGTCALRGGSFSNNADEVKASLRLIHVPRDHRPFDFGFRCALEPRVVTAPPQQRLPR